MPYVSIIYCRVIQRVMLIFISQFEYFMTQNWQIVLKKRLLIDSQIFNIKS